MAGETAIPKDPGPGLTWSKSVPVVVLAGIFDGFRAFFTLFWFFGPLLVGVAARVVTSNVVTSTLSHVAGAQTAAATGDTIGNAAGAIATIGGVALTGPALAVFGTIMAISIGLVGWLTELIILMALKVNPLSPKNGRIFWSFGSLLISEIPIVDTIPTMTPWVFMALRTKIKEDRKKRDEYQEAMRMMAQRTQEQRKMQLAQIRAEREAADDNTEEAIPEEMAVAA